MSGERLHPDPTSRVPSHQECQPAEVDSKLSRADDCFGFGETTHRGWRSGSPLPAGTRLGGVEIIRLLAEGGMGRVYEGRQHAPERAVAVKVLRGGFASASLARRFEYEATLLARLRHPHVAQIFTCGTYDDADGVITYFVMELVDSARPVNRYATEEQLGVRSRVELMRRVCQAVAHGHQKAVIHRDLKPGNILVDAAGVPKVIDFGVARCIDPDEGNATQMTRTGDIVGTLRYMSPEQLGVSGRDVDARSDVFALGLVLHETLAGTLPYDLRGASFMEAARVLGHPDPIATVAVERSARMAGMGASDARSLATIVGRCLEKNPDRRYATASEVEAELGRWLDGDAILARPASAAESVVRFARRHRAATVAAGSSLVALVVASAAISLFFVRAESERRSADLARHAAEEALVLAAQHQADAERQTTLARGELYVSNMLLADSARDRGNVAEAERLLEEARSLAGFAGTATPLELDCLAASLDESVATLAGHGGAVKATGWSPDGRLLASGDTEGGVRIGRRTGARVEWGAEPVGRHEATVWSVAFAPDGRHLASGSADGVVGIWSLDGPVAGSLLTDHVGAVYASAFARDGATLVTAGQDRVIRLWDTTTWTIRKELRGHDDTILAASFAADDTLLATASADGMIRVWDVATGDSRGHWRAHGSAVYGLAFAPEGRDLVSASADGTARIWTSGSGTLCADMRHPLRVNAAAWIDGGRRIATVSGDAVVRIWSAADGVQVDRMLGHTAAVWSLAADDGQWLATGSADGTLRLWDADRGVAPLMTGTCRFLAVACSGDGTAIAAATSDAEVRLWDGQTLLPSGTAHGPPGRVNDVRFSPDGRTIAGGCDDGSVPLWDRSTQQQIDLLRPHDRRIYAIDFSPDGGRLATASEDGSACVWGIADRRATAGPFRHGRRVLGVSFSPSGDHLATASDDRTARIWRLADGCESVRCVGHGAPVNWVCFSPDGRLLATACSDAAVRIWDASSGERIASLTGPARQIWKVAFSPDGARVAAVSADGTVQLWDVASGRALPALRGHTDQVWGLAFAANGRSLVTASWDATARLWGVSAADIARRRVGGRSAP